METHVTVEPVTGERPISEPVVPEKKESRSGLKPISRMQGDSRLAKIVPTSDNDVALQYYSRYARDFVMRNYNFCASKMSVARNGKTLGIDRGFQAAEDWYFKANNWAADLDISPFPLFAETISLTVPHPSAGRLLRLLGEFDRFYFTLAGAAMAGSVTPEGHERAINNAQSKINYIHYLCRFDVDHFDIDGTLLKQDKG